MQINLSFHDLIFRACFCGFILQIAGQRETISTLKLELVYYTASHIHILSLCLSVYLLFPFGHSSSWSIIV